MTQLKKKLPDDKVTVRISACPKCEGIILVCVEHMMKAKDNINFFKEVEKYNLKFYTMPLLKFREDNQPWCNCNK